MKWILIAIMSTANGSIEIPIEAFSLMESCRERAKMQHNFLLSGNSTNEVKQNTRFVCRSVAKD